MLTGLVFLAFGLAVAPSNPDFAVNVTGHGPPAILIPGLMCGGGVWDATVAHLKDRYTCYVLTLPGAAGQPPIKAPILTRVRDEIETYVEEHKLDRPVLIGHSLGGMLSLWLAADKPSLFCAVVSVDGVPALGALVNPKETPTSAQQAASALRAHFGSMDAVHLAQANAVSLPMLITDPKAVSKVSAEANRSDPASVGEAIAEMIENDLRPIMPNVTQPLLVFVPGGGATSDSATQALRARYEAQFRSAPQHRLVIVPGARHFVMLDAPEAYFNQLDEFLALAVRRR